MHEFKRYASYEASSAVRLLTLALVFDSEDKLIVGRVLDVDNNISFHGESLPEFESNFRVAIEDYLSASKELGSAPEKPASGKGMLRIAPEVHVAALKAAARSGHCTVSSANRKPAVGGFSVAP